MDGIPSLDSRQQALTFDLTEALTSSLDLPQVLSSAYSVLARLLPAQYAAMCVSKPGRPTEYDWMVEQMPEKFFARYSEMAAEDFVRKAVMKRPNVVLRDTEMVPSREILERNPFYDYCRELGMPLEYVMAVMMNGGQDWHGGFMLYRAEGRPFKEPERALLQLFTPTLTNTMRNCRMLSDVAGRGQFLEALFHRQGTESIVLAPPTTEVMRTDNATKLLATWFKSHERGSHGLPEVLVEQLAQLASTRGSLVRRVPDTWERTLNGQRLKVTFVPLPKEHAGRKLWALVLQEVALGVVTPACWRKILTPRQTEVVGCVLQGWDNRLIAEELKCKPATVKKHLQNIFDKLGVCSRAALLSKATRC